MPVFVASLFLFFYIYIFTNPLADVGISINMAREAMYRFTSCELMQVKPLALTRSRRAEGCAVSSLPAAAGQAVAVRQWTQSNDEDQFAGLPWPDSVNSNLSCPD